MRCKHGQVVIKETICFRTLICCGCTSRECRALYQPLHDLDLLGYQGETAAHNLPAIAQVRRGKTIHGVYAS